MSVHKLLKKTVNYQKVLRQPQIKKKSFFKLHCGQVKNEDVCLGRKQRKRYKERTTAIERKMGRLKRI